MSHKFLLRTSFLAVLPMLCGTLVTQSALWEHGEPIGGPERNTLFFLIPVLILDRLRLGAWLLRLPLPVLLISSVSLFAIPILLQSFSNGLSHINKGFELILLVALMCLGWLYFLLRAEPLFYRLNLMITLFLVVCSFSLSEYRLTPVYVGAFLLIAGLQMALLYQKRGQKGEGESGRRKERPTGLTPAIIPVVLTLAVFGIVLGGPKQTVAALTGLFPGSGGSDKPDPFGRGGVGEGAGEVAAQRKVDSVGFVNSDVFVETKNPSLYDTQNEMYGEARKLNKKKWQKAINVKADKVLFSHRAKPKSLDAGREFALLRKPPPPRSREDNALAHVPFSVRGRVPRHFRLSIYDTFDGFAWHECLERERGGFLLPRPKNWFVWERFGMLPIFGAEETFEIKLGQLRTPRLPLPNHVCQLRVGDVNREDFFALVQHDIVKMTVETIPSGTTIEVVAPTSDPQKLRTMHYAKPKPFPPGKSPLTLRLPENRLTAETQALLQKWVAGKPRGWAQVEAVVAGLRQQATHDAKAVVPENVTDIHHAFLFQTRRGPDYLFASTTVILLRSLGYPARLVSGFYARPERYDRYKRLTNVHWEDIHFWAEIEVSDPESQTADWIIVEATPGYTMPLPLPTWQETLAAYAGRVVRFLQKQAIPLSVVFFLGLAFWRWRIGLLDVLATLRFRWQVLRGDGLRATLRLLEVRAALAGVRRPPGCSLNNWYGRLKGDDGEMQRLLNDACILFYRPSTERPPTHRGNRLASPQTTNPSYCQKMARYWTRKRLKEGLTR